MTQSVQWRGLVLPAWLMDHMNQQDRWGHFLSDETTFAGVSGGRTSGLMHILTMYAPEQAQATQPYHAVFANTGKEHEGTLVFLNRLDQATGGGLTWLEFVPPASGEAPKYATNKVVSFETASRQGEPFTAFLQMLADYRLKEKGLGPVVPGAVHRLCTGYMKKRCRIDSVGSNVQGMSIQTTWGCVSMSRIESIG